MDDPSVEYQVFQECKECVHLIVKTGSQHRFGFHSQVSFYSRRFRRIWDNEENAVVCGENFHYGETRRREYRKNVVRIELVEFRQE